MSFDCRLRTKLQSLAMLVLVCSFATRSSWAGGSSTIRAWKRTWHGQYGPAAPLRPYFLPRLPGRCDREVYSAGSDCAVGSFDGQFRTPYNCPSAGPGWMYPPEAGIGFEPVQFERLGQIYSDLGVGPAAPAGA